VVSLGGLYGRSSRSQNPALLAYAVTFLIRGLCNHRSFRPWFASAVLPVCCSPPGFAWLIRNEVVSRRRFFSSKYWFEFHLGTITFSNGMGSAVSIPGPIAAVVKKYGNGREEGFLDYYKEDGLLFCRGVSSEFLDLTLHSHLVVLDRTSLLYQSREWWRPWEFWTLSLGGWLDFFSS